MTASTATGPGRAERARTMTPARAFRHALTLAWRSLVRIRRNPEQLLDVTLQPIVFVTLFVFLFGGAIKGESRHTYLQYVLPGIMVMTVVFASMGTGIGLNTDVTKGIFDRFRKPADLPVGSAYRNDHGRFRPLPRLDRDGLRVRVAAWVSDRHQSDVRARRGGIDVPSSALPSAAFWASLAST